MRAEDSQAKRAKGGTSDWRRRFEAATKESDGKKLTALVHEAEFAIAERMHQIRGSAETKAEQQALKNAASALYRVQVDVLGYPDWKQSVREHQATDPATRTGDESMLPPLDIFKLRRNGEPLWIEAAKTIDSAKERIKQLMKTSAVEYMVFSQRTGNRISVSPGQREGVSEA